MPAVPGPDDDHGQGRLCRGQRWIRAPRGGPQRLELPCYARQAAAGSPRAAVAPPQFVLLFRTNDRIWVCHQSVGEQHGEQLRGLKECIGSVASVAEHEAHLSECQGLLKAWSEVGPKVSANLEILDAASAESGGLPGQAMRMLRTRGVLANRAQKQQGRYLKGKHRGRVGVQGNLEFMLLVIVQYFEHAHV